MHQITTGRNTSLMPRVSSTGAIKSMTLPFNMPQQKSFTPSPRAGMVYLLIIIYVILIGGARMTSPSQRFGSPTSNTNPRKQMQRIPPGAQIARAAFVFSPLKAIFILNTAQIGFVDRCQSLNFKLYELDIHITCI